MRFTPGPASGMFPSLTPGSIPVLIATLILLALSVPVASCAEPSRSEGTSTEPFILEQTPPDSALTQVLLSLPGQTLTLEDALRLADESSPELGATEAAQKIAEAIVLEQKGLYDPELFAEILVEDTEIPTASVFAGADILQERTTSSSVGARTRLSFGTTIEAAIDSRKNETNNRFQSLNPEYTATGRLEIRQPLLSGFGPNTRAPLSAAEHSLEAAELRTDDVRRRVRADAETAYWEVFAAERDYAVQKLIVDQAASVLRQTELRAEAGLLGPSQVATAEVFLAQQRLARLDREEDLDEASDRLAEIVGTRPRNESRFRTEFEASTIGDSSSESSQDHLRDGSLTNVLGTGLNEEDFLRRALQNNSNLRAAQADLRSLRAREKGARWGMLPRLDLVGSIGGNGLAGRGQPIIFGGDTLSTSVSGGFGDALRESMGMDFRNWSVGVEFRLPLGLREERGRRDRWASEAWRQEQLILESERRTENQVRDALRRLRHGRLRLELAQTAVTAAEVQVRIGLVEFSNGRSTAFELVHLGSDLATTQRELSRAVVSTATARAELKQLMGAIEE